MIDPLSNIETTGEVDRLVDRAVNPRRVPSGEPQPAAAAAPVAVHPWDKYIWGIYIALLIISVIELYGASSREVRADNIFGPIISHGKMLLLGLAACYVVARTPYKWFITLTPFFVGISILAAIYALFKGEVLNGAARSFRLFGIPIQPSEMLKLSAVLIIAFFCSRYQLKRGGVSTRGVWFCAAIVLLFSGLLITQGMTNTLLLMSISVAMFIMGGIGGRKLFTVLLIYGVIGCCAIAYKFSREDDGKPDKDLNEMVNTGQTIDRTGIWQARIGRWIGNGKPLYEEPMTKENAQEMYAYMAQANGGVSGRLPGNSREASRLPLAFSDFIFSIIIEDWGFIGGLFLLIIYLSLLGRAAAVATSCSRAFPALLVLGMAVMVTFQALCHMAIVTGVFPVSGQPLPLISKGGTSILITSVAFGIMLSVSKYAVRNDMKSNEIKNEIQQLPGDMSAENPTQLR